MTSLRTGYTTGACAAAAAKAATVLLMQGRSVASVDIPFPDGSRCTLPIDSVHQTGSGAEAAVQKTAGDDPDITDGVLVISRVERNPEDAILFRAGEGIGTVTKPGLQIPPGQPAINPGPRAMIEAATREVTRKGLTITLSIPGGRELAGRTFNPRLGIVNGLSILGTTGQVRPFSAPALRDALTCTVSVALACGVRAPVLVPGHIGHRAANSLFRLTPEQVIEVSNEWGYMLDQVALHPWEPILLVGHPGKLAKLPMGEWDTHSSKSPQVLPFLHQEAAFLGIPTGMEAVTAEAIFQGLPPGPRRLLADRAAFVIRKSVEQRINKPVAVVLVSLAGDALGSSGETSPWL